MRHKMAKHFDLKIADDRFTVARKTEAIAAEAALDGIYVVRTSLPAATLDDAGTVAAYKSLALVERAFRSLKTVDLQIRPLYHWLSSRVRAHVFLCMLAYQSNGACAPSWRRCSTMTTSARPPPPSAPASSPKPGDRRRRSQTEPRLHR